MSFMYVELNSNYLKNNALILVSYLAGTNTRKRKYPSRNRNGTFTERKYLNTEVQNLVMRKITSWRDETG